LRAPPTTVGYGRPMSAAVEVRGLVKRYGSLAAVDGIDLTVEAGEIFSILGPNGAGKSTTVEILEGYRNRDAGEVTVLGVDPAQNPASWRARIGVVLQASKMPDELTVRECVHQFAGFYGNSRDPEEVIAAVGLTDKATTRVKRLSGGQQRRLDVAVGVIGRPELLFLDEPTTGFDPEARRQFWTLIEGLRDEGTTVMLTTHYLDEAEALADRVAVLVKGKVVALATPAELGGRATAEATVMWEENGERKEVLTSEPTKVVGELASRFDGEVPRLTVARPSLEDIYLTLMDDE
jgi:ABC-2 type transport system ATP-binding protein